MSRYRAILLPRILHLKQEMFSFYKHVSCLFLDNYSKIRDNSNISKFAWKKKSSIDEFPKREVLLCSRSTLIMGQNQSPNNEKKTGHEDTIRIDSSMMLFLWMLSTCILLVVVTRMSQVVYEKKSPLTTKSKSLSYYLHYILSMGGLFSGNEHTSGELKWWFYDIPDGIIGEEFFTIIQNDSSPIPKYNKKVKYDPGYFPVTSLPVALLPAPIYKISPIHESEDVYLDIKRRITNNSIKIHSIDKYNKKVKYDPGYFPVTSLPVALLPAPIYKISPIHESEDVYLDIKRRITNNSIKIHSIDKIDNTLMECSYMFKKTQKLKYYPCLEELELFHGTKWMHADSICINNFNWRFHGKEVGHKFGKGVCFTSNAMYAAHYSDTNMNEKVMFIAKVLIGKRCKGSKHMKLPPEGFDTSVKGEDDVVVVKYEDNEFYPKYRIKYHISPKYLRKNNRYGQMNNAIATTSCQD